MLIHIVRGHSSHLRFPYFSCPIWSWRLTLAGFLPSQPLCSWISFTRQWLQLKSFMAFSGLMWNLRSSEAWTQLLLPFQFFKRKNQTETTMTTPTGCEVDGKVQQTWRIFKRTERWQELVMRLTFADCKWLRWESIPRGRHRCQKFEKIKNRIGCFIHINQGKTESTK